jgi:hypothetical protein
MNYSDLILPLITCTALAFIAWKLAKIADQAVEGM